MQSLISFFVMGSVLLTHAGVPAFEPVSTGEVGNRAVIATPQEDEPPSTSARERDEILWLARAIYSETKVEDEMHLIGWVIRNRVEAEFRGATTYKGVILTDGQFSGFLPNDPQYTTNTTLDYADTKNGAWRNAVRIAEHVYYAPGLIRPFSKDVRHFYSPIAMSYTPRWADESSLALSITSDTSEKARFAFYANVE